jgi:hypothetical protein
MAWNNVNITVNGETFLGHRRDLDFAVRYESGLKAGDTFIVEGVTYTALSVDDEANRNEILNIKARKVKNDKSKTRRNDDSAGGSELDSAGNDGQLGAD